MSIAHILGLDCVVKYGKHGSDFFQFSLKREVIHIFFFVSFKLY